MKYCLRCGEISSDDSCQDYYDNNMCETCGYQLTEDEMSSEQYALLSETEKDDYEQNLLKIIQNSPVFNERLYNRYNKYGTADFYYYFRFDKYEQITGKKAGRKLTSEEKEAIKEHMDELYGENSPAYQQAVIQNYINAAREANSNVVRCHYCNSTNVKRISTFSKLLSYQLFGVFGQKRRYQWHCNNCNSDF